MQPPPPPKRLKVGGALLPHTSAAVVRQEDNRLLLPRVGGGRGGLCRRSTATGTVCEPGHAPGNAADVVRVKMPVSISFIEIHLCKRSVLGEQFHEPPTKMHAHPLYQRRPAPKFTGHR